MSQLAEAIREATDYPGMFLLYTIGLFLIVMLIVGIAAYLIMFRITRKTVLDGTVCVGISLNEWPQNQQDPDLVNLSVGTFLIGMQDPQSVSRRRLDPRLGFLEKAKTRKYSAGILLERYFQKFEKSGFYGDASWTLLQKLLHDTDFCDDLGVFYREIHSQSLTGSGCAAFRKDAKNHQKVRIYLDLPENTAKFYEAETSCRVSNLCMTIEYCGLPTQAKK